MDSYNYQAGDDHRAPFGYNFQQQPNEDNAPAPAPGQPLLTSQEHQTFGGWTQGIGSLQHVNHGLLQDPFTGQTAEAGSNVWASNLPPMYLGAVMSLSSSTPNPPASTPLRDNPFDWNLSTNLQPNGADIPQYVAPASTQYAQAPEQHNMPQVDAFGFSQSPSATGRQDLHSNQASQSLPSSGSAEEYAFGSDPGFGADHSFVPDHGHTTESIATNMLDPMSYLNPQSSADNTRAPSPQTSGQQAYLSSPSVDPAISAAEAPVTVNGERRSPQKRRLSAVEEHEAPASPSPAPKKRRGRPAKPSGEKAANGSGTKAAKAKKEPRIPLTDEQRRENHLESEQNRRDRDNAEFEALQAIIPGLDDHRTKSGHYLYALKWLKRVIADNESMENLLQSSAATNPEPVGQ